MEDDEIHKEKMSRDNEDAAQKERAASITGIRNSDEPRVNSPLCETQSLNHLLCGR